MLSINTLLPKLINLYEALFIIHIGDVNVDSNGNIMEIVVWDYSFLERYYFDWHLENKQYFLYIIGNLILFTKDIMVHNISKPFGARK